MTIAVNEFLTDDIGLYVLKHPGSTVVLTLDWSGWLDGGEISTSTWDSTPGEEDDDLALSDDDISASKDSTFSTFSAGVLRETYWVTNTVETADGLIETKKFRVKVVDL